MRKSDQVWGYEDCDGPSCLWRSVLQVHHEVQKVVPVPIFQEFKYFETKTLNGPLCLWWSVILAVEGYGESSRRNCTSMGRRSPWRSVMTMTIRRVVRRPSKYLSKIILLLKPTKWVVTIDTNYPSFFLEWSEEENARKGSCLKSSFEIVVPLVLYQ